MIRIEKIKLKDLITFVASKRFKSFENIPISSLRVNSYVNNPNSDEEDYVLYLAIENEKLIGYKTIFSDKFIYLNSKIKFGWLSGTWTHKNYRRKGISLKLFNEVNNDYEGKLMYTNYAEESKAVYDKSQKFEVLKSLKGYRYYFRFCLKDLLPPKSKFFYNIKYLLGVIDCFFNIFYNLKYRFLKTDFASYKNISKIKTLKKENIFEFLQSYKSNELFNRGASEYQWINDFPWVNSLSKQKSESKKYFFSVFTTKFSSDFFQISDPNSKEIIGVFCLNYNDKKISIPYAYLSKEASKITSSFIFDFCLKNKINFVTIYNDFLNEELNCKKKLYISKKSFVQNYFVSKQLIDNYSDIKDFDIQSGDGDVVFT